MEPCSNILDEQRFERLIQLFKALSDSSRVKILFLISTSAACVCNIAEELNMTESAVSHHLKILRMNGLVQRKRSGKMILYTLNDDHVRAIIAQGIEHVGGKKRGRCIAHYQQCKRTNAVCLTARKSDVAETVAEPTSLFLDGLRGAL